MRRWLFLLLFLFTLPSWALEPTWNYAAKKMVAAGLKKKFILEVKRQYEPESFRQTLELNVLLYLKKTDIHGVQVSRDAEENIRKFLTANKKTFDQAEKEFQVSPSVIASLLWIESRHGKNVGKFHVPSVYVHLLQSDNPPVQKHLVAKGRDYKKKLTSKDVAEIKKRTKKKAEWAMAELKALQKMYDRDKNALKDLRGSFSGAFGYAQFIPSSYVSYARSPVKGKVPNLAVPADAIYSVGNYLKVHRWSWRNKKAQLSALMKYNNSEDYARAILKLGEKSRIPRTRLAQ